jgi:hypothetical protein
VGANKRLFGFQTKTTYKPDLSFIRNQIPAAMRKTAGRQGALVRTIARRSIRTRKKTSDPGKPPTNRTGLLRKFIFFSWDAGTQSVVIGPEKLSGVADGNSLRRLEFGGTGTATDKSGRRRRVRYRARPFMNPALDAAKNKLPELWRGAIK